MSQETRSTDGDDAAQLKALVVAVVVARVIAVLVIWLLLFVAMFLGYFTVPIFVVGAVIVVLALPDLGLYTRASNLERSNRERRLFLNAAKHSTDASEQPADKHE